MKIYNSLTKKVEDLGTIHPSNIGVYLCGPTVYDNAHIGHMRKYVGDDVMVRVLRYFGCKPKVVMNITDVGHLVSDADEGEDKMEKGARKYGMDVWQVADKFTKQFYDSIEALNIQKPDVVCKATDYIPEQIEMIQKIEQRDLTYQIEDGIYFDTQKYRELGFEYPELSSMTQIEEGARIDIVEGKRHGSDFALWKFSPHDSKRQMEWESPWGRGFPGWHIECSAMSIKFLGDQFDIHTGGIDHKEIHHPNEIAQSQAATGKSPFVKYWIHHDFLLVEGKKMSKSLGNLYTVQDVIDRGIDPISLRYLLLTTHYRKEMNFTWESLEGAEKALKRLRRIISNNRDSMLKLQNDGVYKEYLARFEEMIGDDLDMPGVMALVWEVVKDKNLSVYVKQELVLKMDEVMGLGLGEEREEHEIREVSDEVQDLLDERKRLRRDKKYEEADEIRRRIEEMGYVVEDGDGGSLALPRK